MWIMLSMYVWKSGAYVLGLVTEQGDNVQGTCLAIIKQNSGKIQ
jgi:hypothetical protein